MFVVRKAKEQTNTQNKHTPTNKAQTSVWSYIDITLLFLLVCILHGIRIRVLHFSLLYVCLLFFCGLLCGCGLFVFVLLCVWGVCLFLVCSFWACCFCVFGVLCLCLLFRCLFFVLCPLEKTNKTNTPHKTKHTPPNKQRITP